MMLQGICTGVPSLAPEEYFTNVSAGDLYALALTSAGNVLAWGYDGESDKNLDMGRDLMTLFRILCQTLCEI